MQRLTAWCNDAKNFPQNSFYDLSLREQLDSHAERLFSDADSSNLGLLELSSRGKGGKSSCRSLAKEEHANDASRFPANICDDRSPFTNTFGPYHNNEKSRSAMQVSVSCQGLIM